MFKTRWFVPLAGSMILALSVVSSVSAAEVCQAPAASTVQATAVAAPTPTWLAVIPPMMCNAWVVTNYYSDAAQTTVVGQCHITCAQYDHGDVFPAFNSGGTCQGVSSAFTKRLTSPCRCQP